MWIVREGSCCKRRERSLSRCRCRRARNQPRHPQLPFSGKGARHLLVSARCNPSGRNARLPETRLTARLAAAAPVQVPWSKLSLGIAAAGLMTVVEPPSAGCTATATVPDGKVGACRRRSNAGQRSERQGAMLVLSSLRDALSTLRLRRLSRRRCRALLGRRLPRGTRSSLCLEGRDRAREPRARGLSTNSGWST